MKRIPTQNSDAARPQLRMVAMVSLAFILIPSLALSALWPDERDERGIRGNELKNQPRIVRPLRNDPAIVTDQQLVNVLRQMRLKKTRKTKINHVDHALRMWGTEAQFDDSSFLSGAQMASILTNDAVFQSMWGDQVRPLITRSSGGLKVRTQQGAASSSHVDHTIATLVEIGVPLDTEIATRNGTTTLRRLVADALSRFSLNQQEYEWTAVLMATCLESNKSWFSREGQEITFDRLATRIMRQPLGQGVCYGGHRLFTLALLYRVDEHEPLFTDALRSKVEDHLREATAQLINTQSTDGCWNSDWPGEPIYETKSLWPKGRRLLATGHALEWWAIAPDHVLPPRETVVRAGQWMVREFENLDETGIQKNYTFLTHAARALAMWRGKFPAEVDLSESHDG